MTLQQLNYFCAICEEMHYTKAAGKVHVSQPSLSYAIRELEKELDVKLFKRESRKLELTEYGEILYQYASKALADLKEGIQAIETKRQQGKSQINIGYLFSISVDFLAQMIGNYYDYVGSYDQVMNFIPYKLPNVAEALLFGKCDIAFATDDIAPYLIGTSIEMISVYEQELFLIVRSDHAFASRTSVTFEEIRHENFVAINPGKGFRKMMDRYFSQMKTQPRIVFSVDDSESLLPYIYAGVGVGILPRLPNMDMDKIRLIPISDYPIRRNVVMLYNRTRTYNDEIKSLILFARSAKGTLTQSESVVTDTASGGKE